MGEINLGQKEIKRERDMGWEGGMGDERYRERER
jgi:hypothetical protein